MLSTQRIVHEGSCNHFPSNHVMWEPINRKYSLHQEYPSASHSDSIVDLLVTAETGVYQIDYASSLSSVSSPVHINITCLCRLMEQKPNSFPHDY